MVVHTAGTTVHSKGVRSLEIRQLERVDLHELQKKCRHCGVQKSYASALSTSRVHSWVGWTQPKTSSTSQVPQQLQQVAAQLQSVCGSDQAKVWLCPLPIHLDPEKSRGKSNRWRKLLVVWTWTCQRWKLRENFWINNSRVEDTAKSAPTSEQKIGKREGSSTESAKKSSGGESRVHPGPDRRRTGGPGSSENTVRTLHTRTIRSQGRYGSHRRTPTRPLLRHHRQHHLCTRQSWSA